MNLLLPDPVTPMTRIMCCLASSDIFSLSQRTFCFSRLTKLPGRRSGWYFYLSGIRAFRSYCTRHEASLTLELLQLLASGVCIWQPRKRGCRPRRQYGFS